ncbi:MAG: roadblock/LC7 domain-containing protein, partial [Actinobacteria bacterium]|nr:roadblock/LC7 domain-containing protein [Actinomycetota bacterium]
MAHDRAATHGTDATWLLADLAQRVPQIRSVVLLSADGLKVAAHGLGTDEADRLAAGASSLWAVARSTGEVSGSGDKVRQVVVELAEAVLYVCWAGSGSVLAVLAGREADASLIGFEIGQLIKSVQPVLATPTRQPNDRSCDSPR